MFLPAAQSFVFLYGNVRVERWLPSGLPVSKLTRNGEKDFIPYMERSTHSDGLTLPGDHMPGNKKVHSAMAEGAKAFDVPCDSKTFNLSIKDVTEFSNIKRCKPHTLSHSRKWPILCLGEPLGLWWGIVSKPRRVIKTPLLWLWQKKWSMTCLESCHIQF